MPNLVILFGPPAAGKASIGDALATLTGYRFFHNHLSADPVAALFDWGNAKFCRLLEQVNELLLFEAAVEPSIAGVIFTIVWDLENAHETAWLEKLANAFIAQGGQVYFVELAASLRTRIAREGTPFRLALKPVLRDVEIARERQVVMDAQFRMNTQTCGADGAIVQFPLRWPHLQIDTESCSVQEAARLIQQRFHLPDKASES